MLVASPDLTANFKCLDPHISFDFGNRLLLSKQDYIKKKKKIKV